MDLKYWEKCRKWFSEEDIIFHWIEWISLEKGIW